MPPAVVPPGDARSALDALHDAGVRRGDAVGLAVHPTSGAGVVGGAARAWVPAATMLSVLREIEASLRPRWVWWSALGCATPLVRQGLRPSICWDVAAVHRLLAGGVDDDPGTVWARLHALDLTAMPRTGQLDLLALSAGAVTPPRPSLALGDDDPCADALDPSGHLRAEWVGGGWSLDPDRLLAWAELAVRAHDRQRDLLARRASEPSVSGDPLATAHSESAAALLCVELAQDGLPVDRVELERLVRQSVGPRPHDAADAARQRRERDDAVLRHLDDATGVRIDLRNPAQVRDALARVGLELPDTRSWRLEPWRDHHPLVGALLAWRKADRIATTYGYDWIDRHVGADDRLRGPWQATDGAAGRMTAGAGLHNLPAELRAGIAAAEGYVLVRADLGQVEPRVLAAISGDHALAAATADPDLYAPVAQRLNVERPVAKVAVLAAMYGQTSGAAGEALKGLQRGYPVAMDFLRSASDVGRAGDAVVTHGGRRIAMWSADADDEQQRSALAAARGRFARNAVVQGSAAELFKAWAVTVRAGARPLGARIVLCLHDELLVHAPAEAGEAVAELLHRSLDQVAARWAPGAGVRFVADVSVVHRWSQAKG